MSSYLIHYGTKGQKWGERRYQNEDGSLTPEGRIHYGIGEKMKASKSDSSVTKKAKRDYNNLSDDEFRRKYQTTKEVYRKRVNKYGDPYMNAPLAKLGKKLAGVKGKSADKYTKNEIKKIEESDVIKTNRQKKVAKIATGAAIITGAAVVAALIGKKAYDYNKNNEANKRVADEAKLKAKLRLEYSNKNDYKINKSADEMRQDIIDQSINQLLSGTSSPIDITHLVNKRLEEYENLKKK